MSIQLSRLYKKINKIQCKAYCATIFVSENHPTILTTQWVGCLWKRAFGVFFEGFCECPFESIVEASGYVSNELQLSALHHSSWKWCRTLYMIEKIIIRINVQKTALLLYLFLVHCKHWKHTDLIREPKHKVLHYGSFGLFKNLITGVNKKVLSEY